MAPALVPLPEPPQIAALVRACGLASPDFAAALQGGASTAKVLARHGLRLSGENRPAEAVEAFRAAVALEPDQPLFWLNLAVALDRSGTPKLAADCLERSLALAPRQPEAWLLLGSVRMKQPDWAGAEAAYREAVQLRPESALAWQCLGLVKQEQGEPAAFECFARCVARGGKTAGVMADLGKLSYQMGRFSESGEAYRSALELDASNANYQQMRRRAQLLCDLIAGRAVDAALAGYQRSLPVHAPEDEANLNIVLKDAFAVLSGFGHVEAAARVGEKRLALAPGSAAADYLLKALTGTAGVERSPADYLVEYFDGYAENFDRKLVGALHYNLPAKLCSAIAQVAGPGRLFDTLDMGCGTGLCGPLLRATSRRLLGVDLSPKMLEQARQRRTYDDLICADLVPFLEQSAERFDLIVAADVLIYFGDLRPVWAAAKGALRPGGLLAFSTELAAEEGYRLQKSGRFAHSLTYVRSTVAGAFEELAWAEGTFRQEALVPVRGTYFVLRRRIEGPQTVGAI